MTAKQRVVVIPEDQAWESDSWLWRERLWGKESFKTRVENATRKVNKRSMIRVWRWRIAGWWWRIELIRNTESRRKFVPQVRGGTPEGVVCDLETGVNWWLEKCDQCGWSSMHCCVCIMVLLQYYGFIMYRHILKRDYMTGPLAVPGIRDRGYVLINQVECVASRLSSLKIFFPKCKRFGSLGIR